MTGLRKVLAAIVVDVSPLRMHPDFRYFFMSRAASSAARQVIVVTVPLQVYQITESSLAVGLIGAAQLVPLLVVALLGGALADAFDRRRLLIVGQVAIAVTCGGLTMYSFSGSETLWPIYVLVALNAAVFAVEQPTRTAVLPTIVPAADLPSALALNQVLSQLAKAGVPALGGLMVAFVGTTITYSASALLALVGAISIVGLRTLPPVGGGRRFGLGSVREGLRYLRRQPLIKGALVIDLNAMVFGMPSALFPALGTITFGGDATTVGLLYSAPGVGALAAALTSGWLRRIDRQGRAIIISVAGWGIGMAAFGFTTTLWVGLVLLAIAGAADVVSAVFRNTIIQLTVSDELRGRISSVHIATVAGGPRLGDLEAGVVASAVSPQFSVVSGGLACAAGTLLIGRWIPELANYRARR